MSEKMSDEKKLEAAQATFKAVCKVVDEIGWVYEKNEENMELDTTVRGDDLTLHLNIRVNAHHQVVVLNSKLPFTVRDDYKMAVASAINYINKLIPDGAFNFNLEYGVVYFRCTEFFKESLISEEVFKELIRKSFREVDNYNEYLFYLGTGVKTTEEFLTYVNGLSYETTEKTERTVKRGQEIFQNLCGVMDEYGWQYKRNEENLSVGVGFKTDDLSIGLHFFVSPEEELIKVYSVLPLEISQEAIGVCLVAACETNYRLLDGDFLYDFQNNALLFKLTTSFKGSIISKSLLDHMLDFAFMVVDVYNDKFEKLVKGTMKLSEYVAWLNE